LLKGKERLTRADRIARGDLDEHIDFIQRHLRHYCFSYGASLIFTSATEDIHFNENLLYQYINHRTYNFDFPHKASVDSKEELFVPAGFDSSALINAAISTEDKRFEDVVQIPHKLAN
jgi:hypothetical protein